MAATKKVEIYAIFNSMNIKEAYSVWSEQYDSNENKTRDLEALALKDMLKGKSFENCLEIGCGTGKNTKFLIEICAHVTAVDLTEEMLNVAKAKIRSEKVSFLQADIMLDWNFVSQPFDLVVCSLVLEHIQDIYPVIKNISVNLVEGGVLYIGELHPFKQYTGSKARFNTEEGEHLVDCFTHHISDFTDAAKKAGLQVERISEHFDDGNRTGEPRILSLLFKK